MSRKRAPTIEAYLSDLPESTQAVLTRVLDAIRRGVPGAQESISYGIPTFCVDGRPIVYCGAFKAHYSVYPATARLVESLGDALAPYKYNGRGTISFSFDARVPTALITRIARLRAKEEAARLATRRLAAKKR